jgi:hypothetical protein
MINLNYDEAKRLVELEIAKEGSDYVYLHTEEMAGGRVLSCLNVEMDEGGHIYGSCLVGRALIEAGVDKQALHENADADIVTLNELGIVGLTRKARHFLNHLQFEQDGGMPWGYALEIAVRRSNTDSEVYEPFDDTYYR